MRLSPLQGLGRFWMYAALPPRAEWLFRCFELVTPKSWSNLIAPMPPSKLRNKNI